MVPPGEPESPQDSLPELVGPYRITGELGRGGMGVVYRADDTRTGQTVALKVLPSHLLGDAEARARLAREARALAALDHVNVCAFLEAGETDGGALFLAMAYHEGETLEARLTRGPLSVPEAVDVARQLARGLATAHAQGVVHRDLKPSNVHLDAYGVARLLDFGIARVEGATRTTTGSTARTLEYAAPEQLQGEAEAASDVWGLGVVLYEMLAGRRPFRGRYEAALVYAILHGAPEPLRKGRPEVPVAVEAVVGRCLEKRAGDRFSDAEAVNRALAAALEGEGPGRSKRVRRRVALSGSLLSVAAVVGVLAWPTVRDVVYPLPEQRQIAVLPFEAPGADSTGRVFADGLAEVLTGELSQFEGIEEDLWVIPFGTVRDRKVDRAEEAWRSLRATLVVTGSVYRTDEGIRLPLQLIDTRTGRQLRSATVELGADELGALASRATWALSAMLDAELRATAPRSNGDAYGSATTEVPAAYEAYLLGLGYLGEGLDVPFARVAAAREQFAEAVRLDPAFPQALVMLASCSNDLADGLGEAHWAAQSDSLVERALALAPDSPVVLNAYADVQQRRGQAGEAVQTLERAVAVDPLFQRTYTHLAYLLVQTGREEEAEALLRTAILRRPADPQAYYDLANFLGNERPREAKAIALEGLGMDPDNHSLHMLLGGIAERLEEDGMPYFEHAAALRPTPGVYVVLGRRAYAHRDARTALEHFRRALSLDTMAHDLHVHLAWALWRIPSERPRSATAFRECARRFEGVFQGGATGRVPYSSDLESAIRLTQCYAGSGQLERARAVLASIRPVVLEEHPYESARLYVLLGDTLSTEPVELLHEAFSRSARAGGWIAQMLPYMPEHRALLRHPRWAELEHTREQSGTTDRSGMRRAIFWRGRT